MDGQALQATKWKPATAAAAAVLVMILAGAGQAETDGYDLSPSWKTGQTSRYQLTEETVIVSHIKGSEQSRTFEQKWQERGEVRWTVVKADPDGGGVCRMETEKVEVILIDPDGKKYRVDSRRADHEALKPMRGLLKAFVDTPITFHVDKHGRVTKVEGLERLRSRGGEPAKSLEEQDLMESASELALLEGVDRAMKAGQSWSLKRTGKFRGAKMKTDWTFTLVGVERIQGVEVAAINGEAEVELEKPDLHKDMPAELKKMLTMRFSQTSGEGRWQIYYDLSRREVVGSNSDTQFSFKVETSFRGNKSVTQNTIHINRQVLRLSEE